MSLEKGRKEDMASIWRRRSSRFSSETPNSSRTLSALVAVLTVPLLHSRCCLIHT